MKKLLLNVCILLGLSFAEWYDQGDGWEITGGNVAAISLGSFEQSMSVTAVVLDSNGNSVAEPGEVDTDNNTYSGDLLCAFDSSGVLRGVVQTKVPPFGPYAGVPQFLVLIGGEVADESGDALTLKLYDASSDTVIDINEMKMIGMQDKIVEGAMVSVLLEKIEDKNGDVVVSAQKAQKIKGWNKLVKCYENNELINGKITQKTKGGVIVEHVETCLLYTSDAADE